jgi:acetyltransferase-like isoleucine patch superfamily enzyme
MKFANITLGSNIEIDPSTSINNVFINDNARIAKNCSIYGGPNYQLEIGANVYIGMNSIINGFAAKIIVGNNVSISQNVNIMVDSGPNASLAMQKVFPIRKGPINIGDHCWIGASSIIMPNVTLGDYCIVAANSFVNKSFPPFSMIGGTPAKLIRNFKESEKEIILANRFDEKYFENSNYEDHYLSLPFEDILREYRKKNILKIIKKYPHRRFLEIGCGSNPLFLNKIDYEKMVVIEPVKKFLEIAKSKATNDSNIIFINDLLENVYKNLKQENFDFIVIGGFLHEIENPDSILKVVNEISSDNTIIYSFVPNAKSFHRLLAYKMGIIENIYQKSSHDELFNRKNVFDLETFNKLLATNKFKIIENGSYFVKPFSHEQMDRLLNCKIINKNFLDGLDKMIDFMPNLGAELWNICKIDDKVS